MATSLQTFNEWKENGQRLKALYMIVVCDTFDYEDYPVYCFSEDEKNNKYNEHNGKNMQRIMEVVKL